MGLGTLLSSSGHSDYQSVLCSNPADPSSWEAADEDLLFAQKWRLRMMAQEAGLKEGANGRLRPLVA